MKIIFTNIQIVTFLLLQQRIASKLSTKRSNWGQAVLGEGHFLLLTPTAKTFFFNKVNSTCYVSSTVRFLYLFLYFSFLYISLFFLFVKKIQFRRKVYCNIPSRSKKQEYHLFSKIFFQRFIVSRICFLVRQKAVINITIINAVPRLSFFSQFV